MPTIAPLTITNKETGEVTSFDTDTMGDLMYAYRYAKELADMSERLKKKLRPLIDAMLDGQDKSEVIDGYQFKQYDMQRRTYNMGTLREVFDEDELSLFLTVNKTKVDNYIKEHLDDLGDNAKYLRDHMELSGSSTVVMKLEKVAES